MPVGFNFQPLQQPDFGQTLDSVFNRILQTQIANKNMQMQQSEIEKNQMAMQAQQMQMDQARAQQQLQYAPFGFQPQDVTPQNVQGGINAMQGFNQAPSMLQNPQGPQAGSPVQQGIAQYLQQQRAMTALGMRKEQAGIGLQEGQAANQASEAAKNNAYLNLLNPSGGGGLVNNIANQVQTENTAPSQISENVGKDAFARMAVGNEIAKRGLNEENLENKYHEKQKQIETTQGTGIQQPARAAQSLGKAVDKLLTISSMLPRSNKQFMNTPILQLGQQFGGTEHGKLIPRLKFALGEVKAQGAQVMQAGGTPREESMKAMDERIPDSITPEQLEALAPDIKEFSGYRVEGLLSPAKAETQNAGGGFSDIQSAARAELARRAKR